MDILQETLNSFFSYNYIELITTGAVSLAIVATLRSLSNFHRKRKDGVLHGKAKVKLWVYHRLSNWNKPLSKKMQVSRFSEVGGRLMIFSTGFLTTYFALLKTNLPYKNFFSILGGVIAGFSYFLITKERENLLIVYENCFYYEKVKYGYDQIDRREIEDDRVTIYFKHRKLVITADAYETIKEFVKSTALSSPKFSKPLTTERDTSN